MSTGIRNVSWGVVEGSASGAAVASRTLIRAGAGHNRYPEVDRRPLWAIMRRSNSPRPMGDPMLYFAYGSNLDHEQMAALPRPQVVPRARAARPSAGFSAALPHVGGRCRERAATRTARRCKGWCTNCPDADGRARPLPKAFQPGDQHNVYLTARCCSSCVMQAGRQLRSRAASRGVLRWRPARTAVHAVRRYLIHGAQGARHFKPPDDYVAALAKSPTRD